MKTIHVVAAVIADRDRIFATQRGYGDWKDYWEFPGGKIEAGETPEEALRREILEELDTEIAVGEKLTVVEYDYPEFHLSMECYLAHVTEGSLVLKEHEAARWLEKNELESVPWLPADLTILDLIRQRVFAAPGTEPFMKIRRFKETDAEAVSDMIRKTLQVSNSRDYSAEEIAELVKRESPEYVRERASRTHFYVAENEEGIIGCGSIGSCADKPEESGLFTIFVHPEHQGKGIGRAIVETLEQDEFALRSKKIEIAASITGLPFYLRLGYAFKNGIREIGEDHLYRLERFRIPEEQQGRPE